MSSTRTTGTALGLLSLSLGCASAPPPEGWRERFAQAPPPPPSQNLPLPPEELERLLARSDFEVREVEPAGAGVMGALRVEAHHPGAGRTLAFKWKPAPVEAEGWNNTPRREIAAYELQKWFLDPEQYVVPPTVGACIPLEIYADIEDDRATNLPGINCVFGTKSAWLEDVTGSDPLFEEERFYRDPHYALHLAHYNLLTYLTKNRDTRAANRLASKDPDNRRVYAVDNGITFGEWFYNWFVPHWDEIRVPALPREAVERLRRVDADQLASLAVVAQYELDSDGILRAVEPTTPFHPHRGVRMRGRVMQIGLVPEEIEELEERIEELLEEVDEQEIALF